MPTIEQELATIHFPVESRGWEKHTSDDGEVTYSVEYRLVLCGCTTEGWYDWGTEGHGDAASSR